MNPTSGVARAFTIGVVSDTHGLLRPELLKAFTGVQHILHAGDVGNPAILEALGRLAPVTAIRGNIDVQGPCSQLPEIEVIELAGKSLYMLHDRKQLDVSPAAAGFAAVISGHSHQPLIEWSGGILYFNPGSAGPRRFSLPISAGLLNIARGQIEPELLRL